MSNIDLSRIITIEDKTAEAANTRAALVKAACKRRIYAVASAEAQMNMIGAQAAGDFGTAQHEVCAAWVRWVADMRAACAAILSDTEADYTADVSWPDCPPEVAMLAVTF